MGAIVQDVYLFDSHFNLLVQHSYTCRPISARQLLNLYLDHPTPRPSVICLPTLTPSTVLFSIVQDGLLFLSPTTTEVDPLLVLEFLHRVADVLDEFLGTPLTAARVETHYHVIAQLFAEICDAGLIAQTEANALRDVVEVPSFIDKLFSGVGLPGAGSGLNPSATAQALQRSSLSQTVTAQNASQIPWRRSNVRHTNNELYVDVVEALNVKFAPSGRPLAAFANGSIAFTSKVSGVPDLLLTLATSSGSNIDRAAQLTRIMERPVFHPCVRLARWREAGTLSFVPPDGRFVLAGYQVDLLNSPSAPLVPKAEDLQLPIAIEIRTGLGSSGSDFEVKLTVSNQFRDTSVSTNNTLRGHDSSDRPLFNTRPVSADTKAPKIEDLSITIRIPDTVRNISDLRASKGEAHWSPGQENIKWSIGSKEISLLSSGSMTLRCTVVGDALSDEKRESVSAVNQYSYDESTDTDNIYQSSESHTTSDPPSRLKGIPTASGQEYGDTKRIAQNKTCMPSSANVSFRIQGWLASGIKVDSLIVDAKRSRGLGEGVKPYKGVKYLTACDRGIEIRC